MCLFPRKNKYADSLFYKKGIKEFSCGCCPECLSKKARIWVLRAVMEAKNNVGMMITLTYDTYKRDKCGNIIGENPVNPDLKLDKKDCQDFFKRLRAKFPDKKIKYIAAGERGKSTNRAHYHALIFGLVFDDLMYYKKSKRGNVIYRSKTLEKIWQGGNNRTQQGGICTVDCINLNASVAAYCTKYAAKDSGVDDTFMLFSHGIGEEELRKKFNGKPYVIQGQKYAIPRTIWQWYVTDKYNISAPKYVKFPKYENFLNYNGELFYEFAFDIARKRYFRAQRKREIYSYMRDNDPLYKMYILKMRHLSNVSEKYKQSPFARIIALDDKKYWSYKQKALSAFGKLKQDKAASPPRVKSFAYQREAYQNRGIVGSWNGYTLIDIALRAKAQRDSGQLPLISRHITATDRIFKPYVTKSGKIIDFYRLKTAENPFEIKN